MVQTVARKEECDPSDVKAGRMQPMSSGLSVLRVRCPVAAALKVVAPGRMRLSWTSIRVKMLAAKPSVSSARSFATPDSTAGGGL